MPTLRSAALALALAAVTLLPIALASHGTLGPSLGPWGVWRTETVDSADVCTFATTGLALDATETPHMVYNRRGADGYCGVWYATRLNVGWTPPTQIDPRAQAGGIDIDSQGRMHVALTTGHALYATRQGNQPWTVETVETVIKGSVDTIHIAVDEADTPHMMYSFFLGPVKYAWRDSQGAWNVETVEASVKSLSYGGIALDSQGQPHIAYGVLGGQGGVLKYAYRTPQGQWIVQAAYQDCGQDVGFALDTQDRPHMACHHYLQGLRYVHHDGQQWTSKLLHAGGYVGRDTSVAVDSQDRPHITYRLVPDFSILGVNSGQLHYATQDLLGQWRIETVDHVGNWNGVHSNLKLDKHDRPHVSYYLNWWRTGPTSAVNHVFDLMYAEPAVATALAPVERLLGGALP